MTAFLYEISRYPNIRIKIKITRTSRIKMTTAMITPIIIGTVTVDVRVMAKINKVNIKVILIQNP